MFEVCSPLLFTDSCSVSFWESLRFPEELGAQEAEGERFPVLYPDNMLTTTPGFSVLPGMELGSPSVASTFPTEPSLLSTKPVFTLILTQESGC